jgi:hypothetical protein
MTLTSQVKDITEAASGVPSMIEAVFGAMKAPFGWMVILVLFFRFLLKNDFSHLFDIFERKEKKRLEHLDSYHTKIDLSDAKLSKVINDLRDAHYFRIATGIYAELTVRNAMIKLHDETSHLISWKKISAAFSYLDVSEEHKVKVREFNLYDQINFGFNILFGILCLIYGVMFFTLFVYSSNESLTQVLLGVGDFLIFTLIAIIPFSKNQGMISAKKIRTELAKLDAVKGSSQSSISSD